MKRILLCKSKKWGGGGVNSGGIVIDVSIHLSSTL